MPNLPDDLYQQALAQQQSGTNPWLAQTAPGVPQIVPPSAPTTVQPNGLPDTNIGSPQNFHESPTSPSVYNPVAPQSNIMAPKGFEAANLSGVGTKEAPGISSSDESKSTDKPITHPVVPGAKLVSGAVAKSQPSALETESSEHQEQNQQLRNMNHEDQDTAAHQQVNMLATEQKVADIEAQAQKKKEADELQYAEKMKEFQSQTALNKSSLEKDWSDQRNMKVDPQHWFKERGVAGTILAAFAMAAGAFGAATPHTNSKQNFAMDIIEKSIDRDVEAQKDDIENKWKALNFKGNQQEKDYAHGQFMLKEQREAIQKGYSDAIALGTQERTNTNNVNSALGIDKTINDLRRQDIALDRDDTEHRYSVAQTIKAQAYAAGGEDRKANDAYRSALVDWYKIDPDKRGPMPSREQFKAQLSDTTGTGYAGGGGTKDKNQKSYDEGMADIDAQFNDLKKNNPLVGVVPNSTDSQAINRRDQLGAQMVAAVHSTAPGLRSEELIHKTVDPFIPTKWDNAATLEQKHLGFKRAMANLKNITPKETVKDDTAVPNATERK